MSGGRARAATLAIAALALLHAIQVWGYWGLFWGDPGQVLHQIERLAGGEAIYREVFVTSPPLGYWVLGGAARWLGTEPSRVSLATSGLFLVLVLAWWRWARRLIDDPIDLAIAIPALVLAASLACALGVALPLGTYAPGSLVGFACLVAALLSGGSPPRGLTLLRGALLGAACAGCVLAKQDFWAPALFVAISAATAAVRERNWGPLAAAAVIGAAGLGLGAWGVATASGWESLPLVATGYGVASESGFGRSAPNWDRITLEGLTLAGFGAALALAARVGGVSGPRWLRGIALAAATGCALVAVRFAVTHGGESALPWLVEESRVFRDALARTPLPTTLPLLVGGVLLARRRRAPSAALDRALWLVGLCLAARLRRGFEMTEWFVALLELPTYVVAAQALAPSHWRRPAPWLAAGAAALSLFCWWRLGDGLGSRTGLLPAFSTERGVVRFPLNQQAGYAFLRDTLDRADPQRARPVFAFGHSGGIAYWLRRENPTPLTYGFTFSPIAPAEAVARLRAADPAVFLVYNPTYAGLRLPTTEGLLTRFRPATRPAAFAAEDAWFSRAREACEEIEPRASARRFRVFDCAPLRGIR